MQREFSARGAVVRHMESKWWIAALEPQSENKKPRGKRPARTVLALPKGMVDAGEKAEQTAVREVREEIGVDGALVTKLKDIRYCYVRSWGDGQRVFKVVSFYLLVYRGGTLGEITPEMRREVKAAHWLPLEEAPKKLAYPGERQVAAAALDYISAHPELAKTHAADTTR